MRISRSKDMDSTCVTPLGTISASSAWHGASTIANDDVFKLKALHQLMRAAEDCDADALVDVDYSEERLETNDVPGAPALRRVRATGVAVKLRA